MAASTITRDTWSDDTGTPLAPNGDGTLINNSVLQNNVYARIDEMFAGAGAYTTFGFGGLIRVEGFGTSSFSAGGTGGNALSVRNTAAGLGNYARVGLGNDATADALLIEAYSTTYATSGSSIQDGANIFASRAGGLSLTAAHGSGVIRFYAGGGVEKGRFTTVGLSALLDSGSAATPALRFGADPDTGIYFGAGTAIAFSVNGSEAGTLLRPVGFGPIFTCTGGAFGTGVVSGPALAVGRNTSGAGSAGFLQLAARNGTNYYLWVESATGKLRIHTAPPTEDNTTVADGGGTVVGTQV